MLNKLLYSIIISSFVLTPLSSCGTKGKLKTPSQIEEQAAKKARKEAKKNKLNKENPPQESQEEAPEETTEKTIDDQQ